jgi:formate hydrogenlyase transcriptional activator
MPDFWHPNCNGLHLKTVRGGSDVPMIKPNPHVERSPAERYEALINASLALTAKLAPDDLFAVLARELRPVAEFDYLQLTLCDGVGGKHRPSMFELPTDAAILTLGLGKEENPVRWVYQNQQSLVLSSADRDVKFPRVMDLLKNSGLRSACILPLKTARRRIGCLSLGSQGPEEYKEEELRFLSLVADTFAVAIDDALNSEASQIARDRLRLLIDLINRVVSKLDLRDLLREITSSVKRVMQCDGVVVSLLEPESNELQVYAIDFPDSWGFAKEGTRLPADGDSRLARIVQTGQLVNLQGDDLLNSAGVPTDEGISALCMLPLTSRGRTLGVLGLGRRKAQTFTEDDIDFLVQVASQVGIAIENAVAYREVTERNDRLTQEKLYLEDEIRSEQNFREIVGKSRALREVLKQVEMVAPTDSTVIVFGETGTGKELIARAVHNISSRRSGAFVKLNCAAIPTGLLESELFGHEKGAFTGAFSQRVGRFELANGGSVFLDEVGEIPLELQPKLLRVLQEREFERLGSIRTLRTDARLIAATNQDLAALVEAQKFRSDLFYRLNVFPIHVPPLRERAEDIPLLVRHFAQQFSRRMHKNIETIPSETMTTLVNYEWPGNIRELQNVVERAVIVSDGSVLRVPAADLKSRPIRAANNNGTESAARKTIRGVLQQVEREQIVTALKETNWIVAGPRGAAARLGMKRSTLQLRMRTLGISRVSH